MVTKRPGYAPVAVDSKTPIGTGPLESLQDSGIGTVSVSEGDDVELEPEYGHIIACECVKASA